MNQSLKSKRDEWAASATVSPRDKYDLAKLSWDSAIQAVIELLGEFDEDKSRSAGGFGTAYPYDFVDGAKFQHEQMLKKLRGES
ncbi:MAG: hypothetical protein ACK5YR_02275 [Pirellula sp.]|jgi:hypothetical protein